MRISLKAILIPVAAVLLAGTTAAFAVNDSYSAPEIDPAAGGAAPPPPRSLYERIYSHYGHLGHDVREKFRDGPCEVSRRWERDGDYEERIKCRGPRR